MAGTTPINDAFAVTETLTETQKLTASDGAEFNEFGTSVSISGDTAIVGADFDDDACPSILECDSGAAYIFTRSNEVWMEQAKLTASDDVGFVGFGQSVSISGDTVIIGAHLDNDACPSDPDCNSGAVYIFTKSGTTWSEQKLTASDATEDDRFSTSVSISGDTVIIGAHLDNDACPSDPDCNSGAVYIFTKSGTTWSEQKLTASDATEDDRFSTSVSISGDTIIVGGDGSAYIFTRSNGVWSEQAKLTASDGDSFGVSVSISGDIIIVGAIGDDNFSGSAYIFTRSDDDGVWSEHTKLTASDSDLFGSSASISGDTAIVGVGDSAYIFELQEELFCGKPASSYNLISGTNNAETLKGTSGNDLIFGKGGNDTIRGERGDDCIFGDKGDDSIFGGDGHDTISGGDGNDTIRGNIGNDEIQGGADNDTIFGGYGKDVIDGGNGDDTIKGGNGIDEIDGSQGEDTCDTDNQDKPTISCEKIV